MDAAAVSFLQMIFQQGGRSQRRLLIIETVRHRTEEKLLGVAKEVVLLGDGHVEER